MNHNIPSRKNLLAVQSHNFAKPAPDSIAAHGAPKCLFDAPAETAAFKAIGAKKNGELAARTAFPVAINRVIFGAAQQTAIARQRERSAIRRA